MREITEDNHDAVCALRVRPDQERFVASVARSLRDAAATPEANPWYRAEVLTQITELIRADGATELLTSYQPGHGEPWPFYQRFGYQPTGEIDDGEIVLRLALSNR